MARTNKYASVNFNDIYDKKLNTSSSSSGAGKQTFSPSTSHKSYSVSASSRSNGMLVLSRPSPKPQPQTQPQPQPQPQSKIQTQPQPQIQIPPPISPPVQNQAPITDQQVRFDSDSISLRPLGKTGSGPLLSSPPSQFPALERSEKESKSDKFVPPHLRPGYVAKKEAPPSAASGRDRESGSGIGSPPTMYGEYRRPKSGGGYDKVMGRRGYTDPVELNRPRSSGTQRSSSG